MVNVNDIDIDVDGLLDGLLDGYDGLLKRDQGICKTDWLYSQIGSKRNLAHWF